MRVHLALSITALLFSINYIISKLAMDDFGPLSFAWLRVLGAFLMLSVMTRWSPDRGAVDWPRSRVLRDCLLFSILGVALNQLLFLSGLARTSAHEAALLITTIPVFVLFAAAIVGSERITPAKAAGLALSCAGALIIVARGDAEGGHGSLAGNAMIVLNSFSYSLYLVLSRPLFQVGSPIRILRLMFGMGALVMLPFCVRALWSLDWGSVPAMSWFWLAMVIAGPTAGAYAINGWALARAESSTVAIYTYLQPVLATLLAALFLGERLTLIVAAAGTLIVLGVMVASRRAGATAPV